MGVLRPGFQPILLATICTTGMPQRQVFRPPRPAVRRGNPL